ncbi:MAG: asparagine synthase (glutamine-hydrolyzing) [Candidatus Omnitrophica bacterium]|nr:asparagine synthase (glutamine-hydrolyzing) [Candidatus Omnitrophota bacterium]
MCGICGFISSKDYSISKQDITLRMLHVIRHRGPDDEGIFVDDDAVLGIRRLSIIDLSGGHQPIHNEDGALWIVFNGEIYNFPELREALIKKGHIFYTKTDTEVIIHAYEEYGKDCVNKLKGMFAFAIWDKGKNELFLARDRFGIKPLYYSEFNGQFIFASEIKAILQFPDFKRELDLVALDQYLTFEYVPAPRSIFKKIEKLPAAHCLIYKNKNISIHKYWDIGFSQRCNSINETEAKERLSELFNATIKQHLLSDVPLGVFLSGGIDSSTITALTNNFSANRLKTFSIGFKEDSFDESRYIQQISDLYHTEHYHQDFSVKDLLQLLPEAAHFLDEPLGDASFFPTYLLSKFTKQEVTVALSGDGGDELFAGYPTYQAHRIAKYYHLIPAVFREHILNRMIMNLPVSMSNFSLDFKAKKFISSASFPLGIRHIAWMGSFNHLDKIELYTPGFKKILGTGDNFKLMNNYFNEPGVSGELNKLQYFDIKTYLQDDLLVKTDRASMANSLEVRVPFLDHELVEFVFSLPSKLRLNKLKTKYILKKVASELLPQNIINRKKKGFGIPVAFWIKKSLKESILDNLKEDKIKKDGLFNYGYIKNLLQQHFANKADNRKKIWTIFMFILWRQEYN